LVEISFLGHRICHYQILRQDANKDGVVEWLRPNTSDSLRKFMGKAIYLINFIPMYVTTAPSLKDMLTPCNTKLNWTPYNEEKWIKFKG
jgi:hypothetical protein